MIRAVVEAQMIHAVLVGVPVNWDEDHLLAAQNRCWSVEARRHPPEVVVSYPHSNCLENAGLLVECLPLQEVPAVAAVVVVVVVDPKVLLLLLLQWKHQS
jgi:hypothetical protein